MLFRSPCCNFQERRIRFFFLLFIYIRTSRFAFSTLEITTWLLLPHPHPSWESDKKIKVSLHNNTNPPLLQLPQLQLLLQPRCLRRKEGTNPEHHASSSMHSSLNLITLKHLHVHGKCPYSDFLKSTFLVI